MCQGVAPVLVVAVLIGAPANASPIAVVPFARAGELTLSLKVAEAVVARLAADKREARLSHPLPLAQSFAPEQEAAQALFADAVRAFESLDFSGVRDRAGRALRAYKTLLKSGSPAGRYAECLHLLAAVALFEGDAEEAKRLLNDAVVIGGSRPSAQRFNPKVQALYDSVAKDGAPVGAGTVEIRATPEGLLWLNGQLNGAAGGVVRRRAGLYLIGVYRPGYLPWLRWYRIHADRNRVLSVQLRPFSEDPFGAVAAEIDRQRAAERPGPALVRIARELGSADLIVIGTAGRCRPTACPVTLSWSARGRWVRRSASVHRGNPAETADQLLRDLSATSVDGAAINGCSGPGQCGFDKSCVKGRCVRQVPLLRRWWFWAAVGAVAATVAVAIAVPLAQPDGPVIEVRSPAQ